MNPVRFHVWNESRTGKLETAICGLQTVETQFAILIKKIVPWQSKQRIDHTRRTSHEKIYLIRGQKVMLDRDLAELYGVETKVFNQAVKRNIKRFPEDFMFRLTKKEWQILRSQFVTLETGRGRYAKYLPYAFTEQGVAMLSSILNSETAIRVNIQIIRVFTKMRGLMLSNKDILLQLEKIERKLTGHDEDIALIFQYLKQLLNPPQPARQKIGFRRKNEG